MPKRIDFVEIGTKNNHLEIIDSHVTRINGHGPGYIKCRCDCGREISILHKLFKQGAKGGTTRCKECFNQSKVTHGLSKHRMNQTWRTMKQRCFNENDPEYHHYGQRGVVVCDLWKNDFKTFYDWSMENGYEDHLQIDRINPAGNYEPNNCRWVTTEQQSHNKRGKLEGATSKYKGVSWTNHSNKWVAMIRYKGKQYNLGLYHNEKEAALVYNKKAMEFFGEHAYLNVIEDDPEILEEN